MLLTRVVKKFKIDTDGEDTRIIMAGDYWPTANCT